MISSSVKRLEDEYEQMTFLLGHLIATLEINEKRGHLLFDSEEASNSWAVCFDDVKARYFKLKNNEKTL